MEYEKETWIESQQKFWFEAASPTVVNQAGLEGKNDMVKNDLSDRKKLNLGALSEKLLTFVRDQSHLDDNELDCEEVDLIKHGDFVQGYQFYKESQAPGKMLKRGQTFYVLPRNAPPGTQIREKAHAFLRVKSETNISNLESAASFAEWKDAASQVIEIRYRGDTNVVCSCKEGMKKKWCEHRVGILIRKEAVVVPDDVPYNVLLGQKKKHGRPRTAVSRARDYAAEY